MNVVLTDIVNNNYCYYELHSGCVKGLEMPDDGVCRKCVADAFTEIVRHNGKQ